MIAEDRERGYVEFRCPTCGQRTTGSTIFRRNADAYGGGEHCGVKRVPVRWIAIGADPAYASDVNPDVREEP